VTITVGGVVAAIVTGQVFTVLGPTGATTTSAGTVANFNNPAVNQFTSGANPFGNAAASSDVTGSASGASTAGASAGLSARAVAGGAAVTGAAVAAVAAQTPPSAPSAGPTSAPISIGPSSIVFNRVGDQQYFPVSGASAVFSQNPSVATASASGPMVIIKAVGGGTTILTLSGPG